MHGQVKTGLIFGTTARQQFEEFHRQLGDEFLDLEGFPALTNLTTQVPGLRFKTTRDRSHANDNPIDTGVNVVCSPTSHFSKSCPNKDHQIVGVRAGNISDGQSLYEVEFQRPQRRVGVERNWNTGALTIFHGKNCVLASHQNTQNHEFVGYISQHEEITKIVMDGATTPHPNWPRGIYQVGCSDDLFWGHKDEGCGCHHCQCNPCCCHNHHH